MERKISKIAWFVVLAWAIIASICGIIFAITYDVKLYEAGEAGSTALFDIAYVSTVCLFFIAIVMAIGFAIYYLVMLFVEDKKKAMRTVVVILILGLVFLISFLFSSSTDVPVEFFEKVGANADSSKMIGAGLISVYLLAAGAVISVLYAEVAKKFK